MKSFLYILIVALLFGGIFALYGSEAAKDELRHSLGMMSESEYQMNKAVREFENRDRTHLYMDMSPEARAAERKRLEKKLTEAKANEKFHERHRGPVIFVLIVLASLCAFIVYRVET